MAPAARSPTARRSGWLACWPCCQRRPHQYHGIALTPASATGITEGAPAASPSAVSSPSSSSSSAPPACCCGYPILTVIRVIFVVLLLVSIVVGLFYFHELKRVFLRELFYIRELGVVRGSLVLCGANVIGALLFLPCVPFTLGAGFLYGTLLGSAIVSVASTVAAVIAFLTARYLARVWIEKSLGGRGSKFRILDNAISSDGFRIVLLIRSSPLHPYGICNYLFGLTSVTGRDYTVASFLGMLPATIMEVNFGAAMKNVADLIDGNLENSVLSRVFFWAGLVVSIIVTILITVLLKRKLKEEMQKYRDGATDEMDEADDDDDFGIEMEPPPNSTRVTSTGGHAAEREHDAALSDTAPVSDDASSSGEVALAIPSTPQKVYIQQSDSAGKGTPPDSAKGASATGGPAATTIGLKNMKRSSSRDFKEPQQRRKPSSAFRAALSPPTSTAALAMANVTPSHLSPSHSATQLTTTPHQQQQQQQPDSLPSLLPSSANSNAPATTVDEEEILDSDHEREALIATKEV